MGPRGQAAGVGGAGDEPAEVADAVAGVVAVPGDAAGVGLAFDDADLAVGAGGELGGGGQAGRAPADDGDGDVLIVGLVHRRASGLGW